MVRFILMIAAGVLLIALGVSRLAARELDYLQIAGYFLAGVGLILYGWMLRRTGRGNIPAAIVFIAGFILTVAGNFL